MIIVVAIRMHRGARSRHPPVGFPAPPGRASPALVSATSTAGTRRHPAAVKVRPTERACMGTDGNRPFQTDALAVVEAPAG